MTRSELVTARMSEAERLKVEVAATLDGVSRSRYVAQAAAREAGRRLEQARREQGTVQGDNCE